MNDRYERVCTIYKNKDTGEFTGFAEFEFIHTDFGMKLYNLLFKANKERLDSVGYKESTVNSAVQKEMSFQHASPTAFPTAWPTYITGSSSASV